MKTILFLLLLVFVPFGYKPADNEPSALNGKWYLIAYENRLTKEKSHRPDNTGGAFFEFVDNGVNGNYTGFTSSNKMWGDYQINNNEMAFLNGLMTEVGERGWGKVLAENFCVRSNFKVEGDSLTLSCVNGTQRILVCIF